MPSLEKCVSSAVRGYLPWKFLSAAKTLDGEGGLHSGLWNSPRSWLRPPFSRSGPPFFLSFTSIFGFRFKAFAKKEIQPAHHHRDSTVVILGYEPTSPTASQCSMSAAPRTP